MHSRLVRQVRVQVDQPREQGGAGQVDDARAGRRRDARADLDDQVALDAHHRGRDRRAPPPVEQARGLHHDDVGGRTGVRQQEQDGQGAGRAHGPPAANHVPSKRISTSPTWRTLPPSGHAMSSGPPSQVTRTRRSTSPFSMAATAAEAAPVPDARV